MFPNTIAVRGTTKPGHIDAVKELTVGQKVWFEPEPDNAYDPDAIQVMAKIGEDTACIGYIPRELTQYISPLLSGKSSGYHDARVSQLLKEEQGTPVGVLIMFFCNAAIPQQQTMRRQNDRGEN